MQTRTIYFGEDVPQGRLADRLRDEQDAHFPETTPATADGVAALA